MLIQSRTKQIAVVCVAIVSVSSAAIAADGLPSREAIDGCRWERISANALGLGAWVQRCDFGNRKIDFVVVGKSLAVRYSDGSGPDPLVDVFELKGTESAESGIERVFASLTAPEIVSRCELTRYRRDWPKAPAGVRRYTFVPNETYRKALAKTQDSNEIGELACGKFGANDDGVQYFESQPESRARAILFVRVGQEDPLFDEGTLKLVPRDASTAHGVDAPP